jgi:hypothetical protein
VSLPIPPIHSPPVPFHYQGTLSVSAFTISHPPAPSLRVQVLKPLRIIKLLKAVKLVRALKEELSMMLGLTLVKMLVLFGCAPRSAPLVPRSLPLTLPPSLPSSLTIIYIIVLSGGYSSELWLAVIHLSF